MDSRMGTRGNNGRRTCPNCYKLRYLGSSLVAQISPVPVRQHWGCSCCLQVFSQGAICDALAALFVVLVANFDISISIEHISGVCNGVADMLSRDKVQQFFFWICRRISVQHQSQKSSQRSCRCSNRIGPPQPSISNSTVLSIRLSRVHTKSYQTGQHRYLTFCSSIKKSPLPTTEDTYYCLSATRDSLMHQQKCIFRQFATYMSHQDCMKSLLNNWPYT